MTFQDKVLKCSDCSAEFVHTITDQKRFEKLGFTTEPKRCRACRARRKQEKAASDVKPPRATGARPQKDRVRQKPGSGKQRNTSGLVFRAECASCGKTTTVPFRPAAGRPVYCPDCFKKGEY